MMVTENDKLEIPDEIMNMSLEELKAEEEKTWQRILADREKGIDLPVKKPECKLIVKW